MTILSYSPSHVDPETLERLTIGPSRQRLLETLVEAIRAEVGRPSHQHHLLIGPRGSGKTHTLTLVAHRLRTDPELSTQTLPLVLAEEEVARHPADLLIKVLQKLAEELEQLDAPGAVAARKEVRAVLSALRSEGDDERALETAVEGLEAASSALGRLLVVTVENLHLLLYAGPGLSRRSVEPGQWALRKLLLPSRGLLLLAGAPSMFGEVCDRRAPFFDFFRIHHLEELPPEEMLELIRTRLHLELQGDRLDPAQRTRLGALAEGFAQRAPKLRGLLPLTGGLPRFAHLLFDLLAETEMQRSVDLLSRFLDDQTPYFQARLDPRSVPEAELEILDFLATSEGPRTNAEIAAGLRAKSPNAIATYMKRLLERGLVRQSGTSKRDVRYDVAEPLFRVWRRFRIGRAEREQIALLAELVAALFEPREIDEERQLLDGTESAAFRLRVLEAAWKRQNRHAVTAFTNALANFERANRSGIKSITEMRALLGDSQALLDALGYAEQICKKIGNDIDRARMIQMRAWVALLLGNDQAAFAGYKEAQDLFQKLNNDLELGNCHWSYGATVLEQGKWEEGLDHVLTAYNLWKKVDHTRVGTARETTWHSLLQAGAQIEPSRFKVLLKKAEPLIWDAGSDSKARTDLIHFVMGSIAFLGPESLLAILPILEEGLAASLNSFLQPFRLAAEIQARRRSADLSEESEEMRRVVREILKAAEEAAPKKKGKGSRTKGKRPSGKRAQKTAPPFS